jgi:hypothetical protein
MDMGYKVCLNIANAESISDNQIRQILDAIVDLPQLCIYVADTFGNMSPEDVQDVLSRFRNINGKLVPMGFHGHNHCGLANANSLVASKCGYSMIDSSIGGLGKNAGNTMTEYMVCALRAPKTLSTMKMFFGLYSGSILPEHGMRNLLFVISGSVGFHSDYVVTLLDKFENDHEAIFEMLVRLQEHLSDQMKIRNDSSSDRNLIDNLRSIV